MISIKTLSASPVHSGVLLLVSIFSNLCSIHAEYSLCWPFNFVPYTIKLGFTPYQREYIKQQIDKINLNTCIYWSDMDETEGIQNLSRFVRFESVMKGHCQTLTHYPRNGYSSKVVIRLPDHCFAGRFVLHEIVHALGFDHEQQRVDRDCYVWVRETDKTTVNNGIDPKYIIPSLERFPYDKQSVMHYRRSSDLKALSERFYEWEPLGNEEEHLTDLDLWKIEYRFCGRLHYCDVHPEHCKYMEQMEAEQNCVIKFSS